MLQGFPWYGKLPKRYVVYPSDLLQFHKEKNVMKHLSRRQFLSAATLTAGSALLAACAPAAVATIAPQDTVEVPTAEPTKAAVEATAVPEPTIEPAKQVTKILMWDDNVGPDKAGTPDDKFWQAMHEKFAADHPEVEVEFQPLASGTEIRKAFISAHAAGNAPDLFYTYPPSMNPYWDQGFLLQMDEYVNVWKQKDDVVDALWYDAKIDGHFYGIPCDFYGMCLWWRKDLFANAGLDAAPATWDELVEFGKKLTDVSKKQYGFGLLGMAWASWYWENFVWQAGGEVTKRLEDKSIELSFTDDAGVQALQFYQDLKFKDKITQENVLQDYDANTKDFIAGRTAMWMASHGSGSGFISEGLTLEQIGVTTLPAGPKGDKAAQIGGGYWTINATSDTARRDAAWTYAVWRTDPETWKFNWETGNKVGIPASPWLPVYKTDLKQNDIQDIPAEWLKAAADTSAIAHTEYIFKDKLEPYFAAPVQQVLTDETTNCKAALVDAAKKMVSEVEGTVLASSAG
jgi:multiple sugar transport system substrate-binding protein